jgi:hypothetical protein
VSSVVLVGNGLSISYNAAFAMPTLTDQVLDAFDSGTGQDALTLRDFARKAGARQDGLEAVLGSLDQMSAALPLLRKLSNSGAAGSRTESLDSAAETLSGIYRTGLGHALNAIDSLSHGRPEGMAATDALLAALPDRDRLNIATLNYDGILPSRLLEQEDRHYDLAAGYSREDHVVVDGRGSLTGYCLRDTDNLGQPSLINLHGSMGWLVHPSKGWWRFSVPSLREVKYWAALRENRTEWLPAVVMTNQDRKSEIVRRHPFDLAYHTFRARLAESSRFAIVGYGFGDEYLNQVIGEELALRPKLGLIVITRGDKPAHDQVGDALDLGRHRSLDIIRDGIEEGVRSAEFAAWATSGDSP